MKLFRVLSLLAALVASASAAHAQSISTGSLRAIREAVEPASFWQFLPDGSKQSIVPAHFETTQPVGQIKGNCPAADETCWFMQLIQGCASSCERLRTQCTNAQANGESAQTAVGTPAHGLCPASSQTAGCAVGVVRCCQESTTQTARVPTCNLLLGVGMKGCVGQPSCATTMTCPLQSFLQVVGAKTQRAVTAPAPCCCAKACACCESCKAKAAAGTWAPMPATRRVIEIRPGTTVFSAPVAPPMPFLTASRGGMKPARLVTPDFEAHCERMSNRGDTIVLEGNVLLLCKKHAQPIRIEAQRVIVNMKDGTFSVEHGARPGLPTHFGVMRTSTVPTPMQFIVPAANILPARPEVVNAPRIIQVVPVPMRDVQTPTPGYLPR
ncbi:MAG: hypothetical protein HYX68_05225 [Planctomycetes bacterium]|nr:hypothetical protein [Planctomycetota bacterium]